MNRLPCRRVANYCAFTVTQTATRAGKEMCSSLTGAPYGR